MVQLWIVVGACILWLITRLYKKIEYLGAKHVLGIVASIAEIDPEEFRRSWDEQKRRG